MQLKLSCPIPCYEAQRKIDERILLESAKLQDYNPQEKHSCNKTHSLMIRLPPINPKRPINLLQQNQPHELMRERHP